MASNEDDSSSGIEESNKTDNEIAIKLFCFVETLVHEVVEKRKDFKKVLTGDKIKKPELPKIPQAALAFFPKIKKIYKTLMVDNPHKKRLEQEAMKNKNITFNDEILKIEDSVTMAIDIFQSYQFQLMRIRPREGTELEGIRFAAKDAVHRLLNCSDDKPISIQNIIHGNSICNTYSGKDTDKKTPGFKIKFGPKLESIDWNTKDMFEKPGLVLIVDGKFQYLIKDKAECTHSYRRILPGEDSSEYIVGNEPKNKKLIPKYDESEDFYEKQREIILNKIKDGDGNQTQKRILEIVKDVSGENKKCWNQLQATDVKISDGLNAAKEDRDSKMFMVHSRFDDLDKTQKDSGSKLDELIKLVQKNYSKREPFIHGNFECIETFIGRENELTKMKNSIDEKKLISITGLGGNGKSTLMKQFAKIHASVYHNFIFINSETIEEFKKEFKLLSVKLNVPLYENISKIERKFNDVVHDVHRYFDIEYKTLFMYDNVEEYKHIQDFIFTGFSKYNNIHTIVTSRSKNCKNPMELGDFSEKDAIDYVTKTLRIENCHEIKIFVNEMERFPLALNQAIKYIEKQNESEMKSENFTLNHYLKLLSFERKGELPTVIDDDYNQLLLNTWNISLENIVKNKQYGRLALEILNISAYISPDNIEVKLFLKLKGELGSNLTEKELWGALKLLAEYSMVKFELGKFSVHRLVQKVSRVNLVNASEEELVLNKALEVLKLQSGDYDHHIACVWHYCSEYDQLIERHYSSFSSSSAKNTPLILLAAYRNDCKAIKNIMCFLNDAKHMNCRNFYNETAIFKAAENGNLKVVEYLIDNDADILNLSKCPLYIAASNGYYEIVKCIHGQNETLANVECYLTRNLPVDVAAENGHVEVVELLKPIDNDRHLFHARFRRALMNDDIEGCAEILEQASDMNIIQSRLGYCEESVLDFAIIKNNIKAVILLLKKKFDLNSCDKYKRSPIHHAAHDGNVEVLTILFDYGAIIDVYQYENKTPLFLAVENYKIDAAIILLEAGGDPKTKDKFNSTLIHIAASKMDESFLKILIKYGADLKAIDSAKRSPLHYAAIKRNISALKFFIKCGLDLNLEDYIDTSPIVYISENYFKIELIKRLIQYRENRFGIKEDGEFTKFEAELLINEYKDLNFRSLGSTALHLAAEKNDIEVVGSLLKYGTNANVVGSSPIDWDTALHTAAEYNSLDVLKLLVDKGGNIGIKNFDCKTPLDIAREKNHTDIVEFLEMIIFIFYISTRGFTRARSVFVI
ncbi:uncharacterized protein LOC143919352 [Arctopsyche grandis]|uniref:uncharacterized protein LOC143919352 n=1 Tax=Arctopsyche grandis TaxID=121162 RepID=UPI00406D9AD0